MPNTSTPLPPALARFGSPPADARANRRDVVVAGLLLLAAVGLAYANSVTGPFLYDDKGSIVYNPAIRHLWPLRSVLLPPAGSATVAGRPILNLSLAINYALGGLDVRGYHLVNVAIHALAALALFGLIRRTLLLPVFAAPYRRLSLPVALAIAGWWALHPLQTESVTYVVQRAESLMSLFYLLTLYGFVRSIGSPFPNRWRVMSWCACLAGMATKENMASAPVILLFFDRTFVAGSFARAWQLRWRFYGALAATWLLLGGLLLSTGGDRGGSVGFDVGVSWLSYALTQFPALIRYAALSLWPHPLIFEYGTVPISSFGTIAWQAVLVLGFIGGTGYALWRFPKIGFLGALILAILAPTSLVPGTTQFIVEHRMYLPLAAVLALAIPLATLINPRWAAAAAIGLIVALGVTTAARNRLYRDELRMWTDVVTRRPDNIVGLSSYGAALATAGRHAEALAVDRRVFELKSDYAPNLANLGIALTEAGQPAEALPYLSRAIQLRPHEAQAQLNLGVTLDLLGRADDALPHYAEAVRVNPLLPEAQNDYGDALCRAGRLADGVPYLQEAIRLSPHYRDAYFNYAAALVRMSRIAEALTTWAAGLSFGTDDASAHLSWANFLSRHGQPVEAYAQYETALRLQPKGAEIRFSYATALASNGRYDDAIREYEHALQLRPDYAEAHNNLANTLVAVDRVQEAIPHYEAALRLRPGNAAAHNNLGLAYARTGRLREAAVEFAAAVQLDPNFSPARENLARARDQLGEP